jgi:hypothetical protein
MSTATGDTPDLRRVTRLGVGVVAAELLLLVAYALGTPGRITSLRYALYPFVWVNVGLLGVWWVAPPAHTPRRGAVAAAVAALYVGVLALLTGLVAVYPPDAGPLVSGLQVTLSPPGWGPRVAYVAETFHVYFVPYRVVGYLSLGYLVYVAVLDAMRAALPAAVGVGSCVGCTLPLAAPGLVGVPAGVGAAVTGLTVDVSTALFCVAVGVLVWRPDPVGAVRRQVFAPGRGRE